MSKLAQTTRPWIPPYARSEHRGFSLVEIGIVLVVVGVLVVIGFPTLQRMISTNNVRAGISTLQVASTVSRAFAARDVIPLASINPNPDFALATYSGTAILFTPGGEMRLVENNQAALDQDRNPIEMARLNAYSDIVDRDYITMPKGAGILGIIRRSKANPELLSPPFAIRFDENGFLVAGTLDKHHVYYDGNYDQQYLTDTTAEGSQRQKPFGGGDYDPRKWDPATKEYRDTATVSVADRPGLHPVRKVQKLPFEKIEAVIGVLVFDQEEFDVFVEQLMDADPSWKMPGRLTRFSNGVGKWLMENGTSLFFNRYSGNIMDPGERVP